MKETILGSVMFLAGSLCVAVLLAGTVTNGMTIDGYRSSLWILSQYGLMPALCIFIGIMSIGLGIAIWGTVEKDRHVPL